MSATDADACPDCGAPDDGAEHECPLAVEESDNVIAWAEADRFHAARQVARDEADRLHPLFREAYERAEKTGPRPTEKR